MAEEHGERVEMQKDLSGEVQRPRGERPPDRGVTPRSIVFGLCLSVGVSLLANTVRYVLH
ncbi:hypothetical protein HYY27_09090, partial [bacterium]|nr:hypothetical protein [bacterium]